MNLWVVFVRVLIVVVQGGVGSVEGWGGGLFVCLLLLNALTTLLHGSDMMMYEM